MGKSGEGIYTESMSARTKAARPFGQRPGVAASTTDVATGGVVGAGVGAQAPSTCLTPHKVDAHWVCSNAVVVEHRSSGSHA